MSWRVNNMRITEIAYNIAVPAPKMDIVKAKKYWADLDPRTSNVNCRCKLAPLNKESK
jgi:hypothetical protein